MYFVDININVGKNTEKEFEDEFGQGMATFLECNVRDKEKFEGNVAIVVVYTGDFLSYVLILAQN